MDCFPVKYLKIIQQTARGNHLTKVTSTKPDKSIKIRTLCMHKQLYNHCDICQGAEPSPAYFNILMWGDRVEVLDGTQLAADWTFSGLQKFGQGMLDRLRGLRLPNPLLEKVLCP
jgi:hypothetical protein